MTNLNIDFNEMKEYLQNGGKKNENEKPKINYLAMKSGQMKNVMLLAKDADDLIGNFFYYIHELEAPKYRTKIACNAGINGNPDDCPACKANQKLGGDSKLQLYPKIKIMIPLYDLEERKVVYWERTIKGYEMFKPFLRDNNLQTTPFTIIRNGSGTGTTYTVYPAQNATNLPSVEEMNKMRDEIVKPENASWGIMQIDNTTMEKWTNIHLAKKGIGEAVPRQQPQTNAFGGNAFGGNAFGNNNVQQNQQNTDYFPPMQGMGNSDDDLPF